MDDYISRQWLLDEYDKRHKGPPGGARKMIEEAPPEDVRPVVYCKDCFAYKKDPELARAAYLNPEEYCALLRIEMPKDGFCFYGKHCPNCGAKMGGTT